MIDNESQVHGHCRDCRHFRNDAKYLENVFAGLTSLSSGYGSVRSDDGICLRHGRYLGARSFCPDFSAVTMHQVAMQEHEPALPRAGGNEGKEIEDEDIDGAFPSG